MTFDERSERNITTLSPKTQELARKFLEAAGKALEPRGLVVKIISGTRTYAEQSELYAIGRTTQLGARRVTNAKAGQSLHNHTIALDVGIFQGAKYLEEDKAYTDLGPIGEACGFEWGGRWKTIQDFPHYQLPGYTLAKLQEMHDRGERPA